jgi:hypothetical protein
MVEHFVTVFDSNFLPQGMALHESLMAYGRPFHLWIICIDEKISAQLSLIALPHVTPVPLKEIETKELLAVKPGRCRGEYCWTLTPFTFQAVFDREPEAKRVTYLDADLFFFDNPQILLEEFEASGKHVLITEHAYPPGAKTSMTKHGRFCVQFLTARRTLEGRKVIEWWREKCLAWCFARHEEGKFGDQKYLDLWPELFGKEVHILQQTAKTLAPWNIAYAEKKFHGQLAPVFYHFHGLRILGPEKIRLYCRYRVGPKGLILYNHYLESLSRAFKIMKSMNMEISLAKEAESLRIRMWNRIRGKYKLAVVKPFA